MQTVVDFTAKSGKRLVEEINSYKTRKKLKIHSISYSVSYFYFAIVVFEKEEI